MCPPLYLLRFLLYISIIQIGKKCKKNLVFKREQFYNKDEKKEKYVVDKEAVHMYNKSVCEKRKYVLW